MDKIMSARVDEATIRKIGLLAQKLRTTKKAIIEEAIHTYAEQAEIDSKIDLLQETCGAWARQESAKETVRRVRTAFRQSLERHQK